MKKPGDYFCEKLTKCIDHEKYMAGYIVSNTEIPRKVARSPFEAIKALDELLKEKYGINGTLEAFKLTNNL